MTGGLDDLVRSGVETAFQVASDFVSLGEYHVRSETPVYDPASDTMTGGEIVIPGVRMIRTKATLEEREASPVAITDIKVLVPASDLQSHTPRETDWFLLEGIAYNILVATPVPGNSLWTIMARKK